MQLYLITNRQMAVEGHLLDVVRTAVEGGVDAVILREKDLPDDDLLNIAHSIKKLLAGRKVSLIINNNLAIARAVRADGYHTGFHTFIWAKSRFDGPNGVSVHSLEEAIQAAENGASYLLAGHIFTTDCKPGLEPKGVDLIREIKMKVGVPVIALGGINPNNCGQVLAAGAEGVAVMSYIMQADDPYRAAQRLKSRC